MAEPPSQSVHQLAQEVSDLLRRRGHKVCIVETTTGGLLSASLLRLGGASKIYAGGLTLYTLASRAAFGDWTAAHVANYAGPTPAICEGLASSARARLCNTDLQSGIRGESEHALWALAESGTAGPTPSGDDPNRQPGYVALAVVGPGGVSTRRELSTGKTDRAENMDLFTVAGLALLKEVLGEHEAAGRL